MSPLVQAIIGSVLRWVLALAGGYFVKAGIWTGGEAENYAAAGALALVPLLWSWWEKYRERQKLMMALVSERGTTESDVMVKIAIGLPVPSVTTSPDSVPSVPKL